MRTTNSVFEEANTISKEAMIIVCPRMKRNEKAAWKDIYCDCLQGME